MHNESFIQNVHQSYISGCSNLMKKIETKLIDKYINTASQWIHPKSCPKSNLIAPRF